ncbi:Bug family tripartite tricarboxylate transporter substrate binding protein [Falsiroseomonas oryzae]|uniref:Bug family tripartite tricarboxylate transporter substrate binding protein n=1 Tax=Falsiroseomonas oryzae TaxID=2766473 RepID=UPI0022EAF0F3|nr:tripartite tricarboxylate transporter substrate binding protein [Roseomonas sp. MO-31]
MTRMIGRRSLGALALAGVAQPALAQEYPRRQPVRLIVPQAAGSATDVMARAVAQPLSEILGQQVVIDNRAGAGGLLGTEMLAKAAPDGYTLGVVNISTHGVNPGLFRRLPYDAVRDFTPIGMTATIGNAVIVRSGFPAQTLAEAIAFIRANPGRVNFASAGQGSSQHLAAALLARMAGGLQMVHIPFRGTGPGTTAVMAGEADLMIPTISSALPAIRSGRARALAVTTEASVPDLPGVPPAKDTLPGYVVTSWYGIAGPANTPAPVVARVNAAIRDALTRPETVRTLEAAGFVPAAGSPAELAAHIVAEIERWRRVIEDAGIPREG